MRIRIVLVSAFSCGAFLLTVGCGSREDLMPLKVGTSWRYDIRGQFSHHLDTLEVKREIGVAGTKGYEISGATGLSRLAWKKDVLYADRLAGSTFSPPLPLVRLDRTDGAWKGTVMGWDGKPLRASGTLQHKSEELKVITKEFDTVKTQWQLNVGGKDVELTTWFAQGIGILRQEQRTNGEVDLILDYLSGPTVTEVSGRSK